jgi:hypothetical protein
VVASSEVFAGGAASDVVDSPSAGSDRDAIAAPMPTAATAAMVTPTATRCHRLGGDEAPGWSVGAEGGVKGGPWGGGNSFMMRSVQLVNTFTYSGCSASAPD